MARTMSTAGSARRLVVSTRSTRPSSGCAASSGQSRRAGAARRFAVALTHDVDTPWRWTPTGLRGAARGSKSHAAPWPQSFGVARGPRALGSPRSTGCAAPTPSGALIASSPTNGAAVRRLDLLPHGRSRATSSTAPRREIPTSGCGPRLVETLLGGEAEVGLHGSYAAAEDGARLAAEKKHLEELAGPGARPALPLPEARPVPRTCVPSSRRVLRTTRRLASTTPPGFRAGIAHPFHPWDFEHDAPHEIVEMPLAAMDVTLSEERYLNLDARQAEARLRALLDWAAEHGGGFAVLWHSEQYDSAIKPGWDRLYRRFMEDVRTRGGVCMQAGALAEEAREWLS